VVDVAAAAPAIAADGIGITSWAGGFWSLTGGFILKCREMPLVSILDTVGRIGAKGSSRRECRDHQRT
jgi:hypothetical protein